MFIHIEQGNCLELIKDVPDNSVELILTDPPPTTLESLLRSVENAMVL